MLALSLGADMRRREFISLLGGAAVAWPLVARAQQPDRMRHIGVLSGLADDPEGQARVAAFRQELQRLGWTDGRNMRLDIRWGGGDAEFLRKHAAELGARPPDVLFSTALHWAVAAGDPRRPDRIRVGDRPGGRRLRRSLARPGGNATGFLQFEYSLSGKWLELVREIAPGGKRAAVLRDHHLTARN